MSNEDAAEATAPRAQVSAAQYSPAIDQACTAFAIACAAHERLLACEALCAAAQEEAIRLRAVISETPGGAPC